MVTNEISYTRILETIYALSALGGLTGNPELPRHIGLDEEDAIIELGETSFRELCGELGATPLSDTAVDLAADVHIELEQAVTDRVLARLCARQPCADMLTAIRARLRTIPSPGGRY